MSERTAFLDELFEKVHETLIVKYFVVTGGHSVWIDLTELVRRRPADGRRWINTCGRKLQKVYTGLAWAPEESYGGFSLRIFAANVTAFKRCMQWRSEELVMQSDMFPHTLLPLLPRSDIKLSDILDRFADAAHAACHVNEISSEKS